MAQKVNVKLNVVHVDNALLGAVKEKCGLRDKGSLLGNIFPLGVEGADDEGELRPEYVQKIQTVMAREKKKGFKCRTLKDLDELFGMD